MRCAIVTPIGPGHAALYEQSCLPSVRAAEDYHKGPFDQIVPIGMDDSKGRYGRSNRRNAAVKHAFELGVDWVFFLDADDTLTPNAFEAFERSLKRVPDAAGIWGLICESDPREKPFLRDDQPAELASYSEFLATPPWLAIQIGGFVRTSVAAQHPFDENMDAGEDYRFYLDLWSNYKCRKFPEIFFVNHRGQHSTGPRSATGQEWRAKVDRLWADEVANNQIWASVSFEDTTVSMRITNPLDIIQASHVMGRFFDEGGLRSIRNHLEPGAHVVDVGANIGNHTIWFCKVAQAARVFPIEPNPTALKILDQNLRANDVSDQIDPRGLGLGVGAKRGRFTTATDDRNNLGATRLEARTEGDIEVIPLDALLGPARVDLIKIDAEGMEMEVLAGASGLISVNRPLIWIEILRNHQLDFAQRWCRSNNYLLRDAMFYVNTVDYLAVPEETL